MILKWFDTSRSEVFGKELAAFIMKDLSAASMKKRDAKFSEKAEKVLVKAARRIAEFRKTEPLNFYKRSKVANAFLWTLKDAGCPKDYTSELTRWLTVYL